MDKYTTLQNEKRLNILHIKRLSVNSINHGSSFWVKVGQTDLFISSNRLIVCWESSIVQSDVYFFVQDSPILLQWSVAALFQYLFVETLSAKLKFNRGGVIAAVCLTT